MNEENSEVVNNEKENRFEINLGGETALIQYRKDGETLNLFHTEVPPEFEGEGVGSRLVKGALEQIKADGRKIIPSCRFVAAYLKRHSEYRDLVE